MRVYGVDVMHESGQRRAVVAARSLKAAAALLDMTAYALSNYGEVTGNAHEVCLAMSEPGTVFVMMADSAAVAADHPWERWVPTRLRSEKTPGTC